MPGETQANISGWTVDTLHAHVNRLIGEHDRRFQQLIDERDRLYLERFLAAEKAVAAALLAADRAVTKSETAASTRFESVNEFRAQLGDQARTFMPRAESDSRYAALIEKIETDRRTQNERFSALAARMDRSEGKGAGLSASWGFLVGAIGALGGLVALIITLSQ